MVYGSDKLTDNKTGKEGFIGVDLLKQINLDIQLAERYPRNLDEILDKAAEYHKLNLCDIKPIEAYGIHI